MANHPGYWICLDGLDEIEMGWDYGYLLDVDITPGFTRKLQTVPEAVQDPEWAKLKRELSEAVEDATEELRELMEEDNGS
jgi:hypothetical protein